MKSPSRSKAIHKYLIENGLLNGTADEIAKAKKAYRLHYQREWKKSKVVRKCEVRPGFSPKDYHWLKAKAALFGQNPTSYTKALVIASLQETEMIPHKERLQAAYQILGMVICITPSSTKEYGMLREAEKILEDYLR
jgi:hypothetical protein